MIRRSFIWFCLLFLLALLVFVLTVRGSFVTEGYAVLLHPLQIILMAIVVILAVAAYRRSPYVSDAIYAEIAPFRTIIRDSKYDGDVLASRFRMMIEQLSSESTTVSELAQTSPLQVRFGVADVSVPILLLTRLWMWMLGRKMLRVETIIDENVKPARLVMQFSRSPRAINVEESPLSLDRALFELARALLRLLDPVTLARSYYLEANYPEAISIYKAQIREDQKEVTELELELVWSELVSFRTDAALERLQRFSNRRLSKALISRARTATAVAHFDRGEYDLAAQLAREQLVRGPSREETVQLQALLANVSACKDDFANAVVQWDEVKKMIVGQLSSMLHSPLSAWSQLMDEVGTVSEKGAYIQLVYGLYNAWNQQGDCLQRIGGDPVQAYTSAYSSLEALNLVDFVLGRPRQLGARTYRALARHYQATNNLEAERTALQFSLGLIDNAIQRYVSEIETRPGDIAFLMSLAWSRIEKFNCLHRMGEFASGKAREAADAQTATALAEVRKQMEALGGSADRFIIAWHAYGQACISSIQTTAPDAVAFLRTAIDQTRSEVTHFSKLINNAKLEQDFENVRSNASFHALIYGK